MNVNWFKYASPASFLPLAHRLARGFIVAAAVLAIAGLAIGLVIAPTDATQGDAYRIIFIHVPAAWMAMLIYVVMAGWSALALGYNTRLSAMMAQALAPTGASMAFLALWKQFSVVVLPSTAFAYCLHSARNAIDAPVGRAPAPSSPTAACCSRARARSSRPSPRRSASPSMPPARG